MSVKYAVFYVPTPESPQMLWLVFVYIKCSLSARCLPQLSK